MRRLSIWLVLFGCCLFILVLGISAYWEADIRWLHFFQAWMYVATVLLALRGNRWGYFLGIAVAGFWCYTTLFVNTFFVNGLQQLFQLLRTGHLSRPDLLIAVPGWIGNWLVVVGCLWAYAQLPAKSVGDALRLAAAFIASMGFFALDMVLFQPRYLPLFRAALRPHLPPW